MKNRRTNRQMMPFRSVASHFSGAFAPRSEIEKLTRPNQRDRQVWGMIK
jgi:hypothetical protein